MISIDPGTLNVIKTFVAIIGIILCVMLVVAPLMNAYNLLVDSDIQVQRAAHNVQTDLEPRAIFITPAPPFTSMAAKKQSTQQDQQWNGKAQERRDEMRDGVKQVRGVYTQRTITTRQIFKQ